MKIMKQNVVSRTKMITDLTFIVVLALGCSLVIGAKLGWLAGWLLGINLTFLYLTAYACWILVQQLREDVDAAIRTLERVANLNTRLINAISGRKDDE